MIIIFYFGVPVDILKGSQLSARGGSVIFIGRRPPRWTDK